MKASALVTIAAAAVVGLAIAGGAHAQCVALNGDLSALNDCLTQQRRIEDLNDALQQERISRERAESEAAYYRHGLPAPWIPRLSGDR